MRRFWYFDVSVWSVDKNRTDQGCVKIVFSLHTARTENPYTPQTYSSASNFHEYHSDTPRHPSGSSQTPPDIPRENEMPTDNKRCQETLPDFLKQHLSVSWGLWQCLLACVGMSCSAEMPWGYQGNVWGCLGESELNSWKS